MLSSTASCSRPGRTIGNRRFLRRGFGCGLAWRGTGSAKHEMPKTHHHDMTTREDATKDWKGTCGPYSNSQTNERGLLLLEFASYND